MKAWAGVLGCVHLRFEVGLFSLGEPELDWQSREPARSELRLLQFVELLEGSVDRDYVREAVSEYIEVFNNRIRRHSTMRNSSPAKFEEMNQDEAAESTYSIMQNKVNRTSEKATEALPMGLSPKGGKHVEVSDVERTRSRSRNSLPVGGR